MAGRLRSRPFSGSLVQWLKTHRVGVSETFTDLWCGSRVCFALNLGNIKRDAIDQRKRTHRVWKGCLRLFLKHALNSFQKNLNFKVERSFNSSNSVLVFDFTEKRVIDSRLLLLQRSSCIQGIIFLILIILFRLRRWQDRLVQQQFCYLHMLTSHSGVNRHPSRPKTPFHTFSAMFQEKPDRINVSCCRCIM